MLAAITTRFHWYTGILLVSGLCTFVTVASQAAIIADSQADWDTALPLGTPGVPDQGLLNWQYGYYATDDTPSTFAQLTEYNVSLANAWTAVGETNPRLTRDGTHPGFSGALANRWTARRWTSPFTGTITVSGVVQKFHDSGGNGSTARFYVNNTELLSEAILRPSGDITPVNYSFDIAITAGDTLDFVADPLGQPSFDAFAFFTAQIDDNVPPPVPEPASLGLLAIGLTLFRRRLNTARQR